MNADGLADAVRVAGLEGVNDMGVMVDHPFPVAAFDGRQKPGAPKAGQKGAVNFGQRDVVRGAGNGAVKGHVDLEHVDGINQMILCRHLVHDGRNRGDLGIGRPLTGKFARQLFDRQKHFDLVRDLLDRRSRDDRASGGPQLDQTFGGQNANRLAQGGPADPHLGGVITLFYRGTGQEFAAQDVAPQLGCDLFGKIGFSHPEKGPPLADGPDRQSALLKIWYTEKR